MKFAIEVVIFDMKIWPKFYKKLSYFK